MDLDSIDLHAQESKVQIPPCGAFDHRDVHWEITMRHYGRYHKDRLVEQCFVPINRIKTFVAGEEYFKGMKCRYMRTRISDNTKQPLLYPCINNALYVDK